MTDSLGFRKKFAVIAPSTNTSVQPEFDAMAPRGVTNHFGRISARDVEGTLRFSHLRQAASKVVVSDCIIRLDDERARNPFLGSFLVSQSRQLLLR